MTAKNFSISNRGDGVRVLLWETITESDTCLPVTVEGLEGAVGNLQAVGTFGGATVALQGSNDGATWTALNDQNGDAIALATTSGVAADFSTAMRYIRPSVSGGSSQDLDLYLCLREGR